MGSAVASDAPGRPALRYHGGKWRLAPWIISHFPTHRVYVEPFGGGASVLLRKPRSCGEVYNDLDGEIVSFFRVLRDPIQAARLRFLLETTPFAREEFRTAYEPADDPVESARRLLIRSFMGFGSDGWNATHVTGFRANSNRSGTTPAQDWRHYPEQIDLFTDRLRGVVIENRNASEVISQHDGPRTLIYADPPYVHETRARVDKGRGYRHEMSDADHEALAEQLDGAEGAVVLSGYRCALYDRLYSRWRRVERMTHADGARPRVECLWLNPQAEAFGGGQTQDLFRGVS